MTGRHAGYIVTLADDIREDDAEEGVLNAIRMIKGVINVKPVTPSPALDIAWSRRDTQWRAALTLLALKGPEALKKAES